MRETRQTTRWCKCTVQAPCESISRELKLPYTFYSTYNHDKLFSVHFNFKLMQQIQKKNDVALLGDEILHSSLRVHFRFPLLKASAFSVSSFPVVHQCLVCSATWLLQYLHIVLRHKGPFSSQVTLEPFLIDGLQIGYNVPGLREKEWWVEWMAVLIIYIRSYK